ncbi:MAG: glucosyl-3-phosphoglycerate synthase [Candidatus Bathyarchaeota archaeon]|nr:glucosyl-3-phosphoglycerate synthase [Candidatus Bathyarchaeota archaeon]
MDIEQERIGRIHDYSINFETLKNRLNELSDKYPSGVIIPIIGQDLESPALPKIIKGLNKCEYLKKVYIALSAADESEYNQTLKATSKIEIPCDVIWCNRPQVELILADLKKKGLDVTGLNGKGKDVWLTTGIASLELHAIAIHDADILTYSEAYPTKLLYTIVDPRLDFTFSKGYYARVNLENKKMYGRIYRLFINPLLAALQKKLDNRSTFIRYLQAFRYPLSGEMAIYTDLALNLRSPSDWGLEIGILAELYRNVSNKRICEVDLGFFEHKHKAISHEALLKTAEDSFTTLLRTLTETEGIDVSNAFLLSLEVIYRRFAQDRIRQYQADALCNSLDYDRHQEETTVDALSEVIVQAGKRYLQKPTSAQLPDWLRILSAMPDAREKLREASMEK